MNKVLILGAGRLGKGFLGETFDKAGWDITFLDKDKRVIDALKKEKYFTVNVHQTDKTITRKISNYKAFTTEEQDSVVDSFLSSDAIMLPLYPEDFKKAAEYLKFCFNKQYEVNPSKKLTLICLTNKNHIINQITENFKKHLKDKNVQEWFDENVVVRDCIVKRSTDAETNYSTNLRTTAVASSLVQPPVYCDLSGVEWLELKDNIRTLKDVKVFIINGPHATSAYYGYLKNYTTIEEANKDPEIKKLVNQVHETITKIMLKEYPITKKELDQLESFPAANDEMPDAITRVAYDPIRKLSKNDRLTGAALLCEKYNIDYHPVAQAIACGLAYNNSYDENAVKIQKNIQSQGIRKTIDKFLEISENDKLTKTIIDYYNKIMER